MSNLLNEIKFFQSGLDYVEIYLFTFINLTNNQLTINEHKHTHTHKNLNYNN